MAFQFTRAWERATTGTPRQNADAGFQFTRAWERATSCTRPPCSCPRVSIHARLGARDSSMASQRSPSLVSIHARLGARDCLFRFVFFNHARFQFTRAWERATMGPSGPLQFEKSFNSRALGSARLSLNFKKICAGNVSIHARLGARDLRAAIGLARHDCFNSRALGSARPHRMTGVSLEKVSIHARLGARDSFVSGSSSMISVSIHARLGARDNGR